MSSHPYRDRAHPQRIADSQRLADNVAAGLDAQRAAKTFIDQIRGETGDGDELFREIQSIAYRPEAYRRAWLRRVQKALAA